MSKALDLANDLSSFEVKYDSGTLDAVTLTNSVVDGGQLLGIDIDGSASAGDAITVNVTNATDGQLLFFSSGILVNQAASTIDHDALTNFVANEHIDWTSTTENFSTTGTFSSGAGTITNDSTASDTLLLQTTDSGTSAAPILTFDRNNSSPSTNSSYYLGQIKFKGNDSAGNNDVVYAKITGKTSDSTDGSEDGLIEYAVQSGGSNKIVMRITGSALKVLDTSGSNGTDLEVDGNINTGGTQRISSAGVLSNVTAAASIITSGTFDDNRISSSNVTQHLGSYALSANVPTSLNDLTDVTVTGSEPAGEALVSDGNGGFSPDPLTPLMLAIALG